MKMCHVPMIALVAFSLSGCLSGGSQGSDINTANVNESEPAGKNPTDEPTSQDDTSTEVLGTTFKDKLNDSDLSRLKQAQDTAFQQPRGGVPIVWRNTETSHSGQVTSGPIYTINSRRCRDFIQFITISGEQESENGVACQQTDGKWQVIAS